MWEIFFTKKARADLLSLEKEIVKRIFSKLEKTKHDPESVFVRLVGSKYCKLRVGDYRVIAFLNKEEKLVEIRRVGHRRNIYRENP